MEFLHDWVWPVYMYIKLAQYYVTEELEDCKEIIIFTYSAVRCDLFGLLYLDLPFLLQLLQLTSEVFHIRENAMKIFDKCCKKKASFSKVQNKCRSHYIMTMKVIDCSRCSASWNKSGGKRASNVDRSSIKRKFSSVCLTNLVLILPFLLSEE